MLSCYHFDATQFCRNEVKVKMKRGEEKHKQKIYSSSVHSFVSVCFTRALLNVFIFGSFVFLFFFSSFSFSVVFWKSIDGNKLKWHLTFCTKFQCDPLTILYNIHNTQFYWFIKLLLRSIYFFSFIFDFSRLENKPKWFGMENIYS